MDGGLNTYGYANANPNSYIDPDGNFAFLLAIPLIEGGLTITGFDLGMGALIAGMASMTGDTPAEGIDDRSIAKPETPKCGCTCNCRADANDNIVGNLKQGKPKFAFGTATASNCAQASKEAKRNATRALGLQPKHVGCRCEGK